LFKDLIYVVNVFGRWIERIVRRRWGLILIKGEIWGR
jgi:hypothetical protein